MDGHDRFQGVLLALPFRPDHVSFRGAVAAGVFAVLQLAEAAPSAGRLGLQKAARPAAAGETAGRIGSEEKKLIHVCGVDLERIK